MYIYIYRHIKIPRIVMMISSYVAFREHLLLLWLIGFHKSIVRKNFN